MYSVEQFIELSPPEAHSEDALSDEHQLMLNRLGFELVERQRFNLSPLATIADSRSLYICQTGPKGQRTCTREGRIT
jgi:hypothetical protein